MLQCCRSQCIAGHVLLPKHKDAWLQPESRLNHICICWCRDNLQSVVSCKIINSPAFKFTSICQNNGESRQLLQVMTYLFVVLFTFRVRSCPVAQAGEACSSCSGIPNPDCTSKPAPGYCCKSEGFVFILSKRYIARSYRQSVPIHFCPLERRTDRPQVRASSFPLCFVCTRCTSYLQESTHTQNKNKLKRKENHRPWSPASAELLLPRQLGDFCGVGWSGMVRPVGAY